MPVRSSQRRILCISRNDTSLYLALAASSGAIAFLLHVISADEGLLAPGKGYCGRGCALLVELWSRCDF